MPKPAKNTDGDQDETVCLLSAQQQDSPGPHQPSSSGSAGSSPSFQAKKAHLAAGDAEKTFYSVCGGQGSSTSDPVSMASIAAVRDILSDIESRDGDNDDDDTEENKENSCTNCAEPSSSSASTAMTSSTVGQFYSRGAALSGTSSSLVVDVHLPPEERGQVQVQQQQKLCKHSVSRFQRCYSDGSQAQHCSPKKKARQIGGLSYHGGAASTLSAAASVSSKPHRYSCGDNPAASTALTIDEDNIIVTTTENPDRIETVSEVAAGGADSGDAKAASSLKNRLRHFSDTHSAKRKMTKEAKEAKAAASICSPSRVSVTSSCASASSAPRSSLFHFISHKKKPDAVVDSSASVVLPTSIANPNVKLDVFANGEPRSASAAEREFHIGDEDDDDEDEDEDDELATTDLLKKKKRKGGKNKNMMMTPFLEQQGIDSSDAECGKLSGGTYFHPGDSPFRDWNNGGGRRDTVSCLSQSSSTVSMPACRICQLPSMEPNNSLISPCRCLGSIRYVHNNCLLKWLEVSSRRRNGPPCCELCQYQYLRHKKFVISHWRFPECSLKDKVLHLFFIFCVCIMIACAAVTIICFKEERWPYRHSNKYQPGELTPPELISLSCAILFFSAFFLAMYVELKAKHTVYQLVCKFFYMNHEWSVEEYDRKRDVFRKKENEDGHG